MRRSIWLAAALLPWAGSARAAHPLAPLTAGEITKAVEVLAASGKLAPGTLFPYIVLEEPSKEEVRNYSPDRPPRRVAWVSAWEKTGLSEWRVDLGRGRILSSKKVAQGQAPILPYEYTTVPELVRGDSRWQAAMKARGISDFKSVLMDVWAPGPFLSPEQEGLRIAKVTSYLKGKFTNPYAHPIEVAATVDLTHGSVLEVRDSGNLAVSSKNDDFDPEAVKNEPPVVGAPATTANGPIQADANEVNWNGWRFRYALHPREGLVLYTVSHRGRSILYRASLSEMVVPYADPDGNWVWRNAFDVGEYGEGRMASPHEPGLDAPAQAVLLDAELADEFGKPLKIPRAIAVYERDGGVLWRHQDVLGARMDARRGSELVIQFITTVSNYDYILAWVFKQDGTIELEAALTGIMLAKAAQAGHGDHLGHAVAPGVLAVHHQHFFNFRLDFDVDGESNSVLEMGILPAPAGKENPYGNAVRMEETVLRSEKESARDMDLASQRKWKIFNPEKRNGLGAPTAYLLIPGENSRIDLLPDSPVRKKAAFVDHHFWVTRFHPEERYAAGDYPNQGPSGEGLPKFVADGESLEGKDLVVWYTFGVTHVPRPEEWPVMAVHKTGFKIVPAGFYDRNPAMGPQR